MQLSYECCRIEFEDEWLVRLFLASKMAGIPVHAYFPMGRATRAAGRAAIDYFVDGLLSRFVFNFRLLAAARINRRQREDRCRAQRMLPVGIGPV